MSNKDLLTDVIESGSNAFTKHIMDIGDSDEQREAIKLITSQFISFKHFAENQNFIINQILNLVGMKNIDTIIAEVALNFRQLFGAERVHLWINESVKRFLL